MRITRSRAKSVATSEGAQGLSRLVDRMIGDIELCGNELVSISHTAHGQGEDEAWTVLVTYCKQGAAPAGGER